MKSTHVSLVALAALFAVSQAQAMQAQNMMMKLRDMAADKYRKALQVAGNNFKSVEHATTTFTHVNNKIFTAWAAADAYDVEATSLRENPSFNPITSKAMDHMIKTKQEARDAYTKAYGSPESK